jgi:MFS family permease
MAYWIGFILCIFSFLCILLIFYTEISFNNENPNFVFITDESNNASINIIDAFESFKITFYFLVACGFFIHSSINTYINFSVFILAKIYQRNKSKEKLEKIQRDFSLDTGLIFVFSGIFNPIVGYIQKKYGKRPLILLLACIIGIIGVYLLFNDFYIIGIILMGICLGSTESVVWSTIAVLNQNKFIGIANSFTIISNNLGLIINPSILAGIFWKHKDSNHVFIY